MCLMVVVGEILLEPSNHLPFPQEWFHKLNLPKELSIEIPDKIWVNSRYTTGQCSHFCIFDTYSLYFY